MRAKRCVADTLQLRRARLYSTLTVSACLNLKGLNSAACLRLHGFDCVTVMLMGCTVNASCLFSCVH